MYKKMNLSVRFNDPKIDIGTRFSSYIVNFVYLFSSVGTKLDSKGKTAKDLKSTLL